MPSSSNAGRLVFDLVPGRAAGLKVDSLVPLDTSVPRTHLSLNILAELALDLTKDFTVGWLSKWMRISFSWPFLTCSQITTWMAKNSAQESCSVLQILLLNALKENFLQMKYVSILRNWCKNYKHPLCEIQAAIKDNNNLCLQTITDVGSKVACIIEKDEARFKWVREWIYSLLFIYFFNFYLHHPTK